MKALKKLICMIISVSMLVVPVNATEASTRSSSYISAYDSAIFKTSSFQFEVWFTIVGKGTMDEIGVSQIRVQRKASETDSWTTVKTYIPEDYPTMMCEDTYSHTSCVTYVGTPGYYYRAVVTFCSKKDNGVGYITDYAETIYL